MSQPLIGGDIKKNVKYFMYNLENNFAHSNTINIWEISINIAGMWLEEE